MSDHRGVGEGPAAGSVAPDVETTPARSSLAEHDVIVTSRPGPLGDEARRRDRVRWGPVWAGLVVTIATYLLLQLALFALGALDLDLEVTGDLPDGALLSGLAGLVAFFLGGLVAGSTSFWRSVTDGLTQGVVMWAVGIVAIVVLSFIGSGFAVGVVGDVAGRLGDLTGGQLGQDINTDQAVEDARDAAATAVLVLGLTLAAAALGGMAGAKLWPPAHEGRADVDVREPVRVSDTGR